MVSCFWLGLSAVPSSAQGFELPEPVGAYFDGVFPPTAPGQATGWEQENAFPNLTFIDPLWLTEIPGSGELLLVGKNGQLWRFPNNPAATPGQVVKVLEWATKTQTSEDQGFYSLVFHPEFGEAGSPDANHVYVCYNHRPALPGADENHSYWRVSRFTWLPASGTLDPDSELVLMNQYDRCRWHNGGAMFFDNEGFLNITCGDGGDSSEGGGLNGPDGALSRTQRLDFGLFSGVFRIDVDNDPAKSHPIRRQPQSPTNKPAGWPESFTQGYGIPHDNPWQDPGGSILEEYHSLGLRSPHTAHFDAASGEIWIGDVGEGQREEMTMLPMGGNAQWGFREGANPGPAAAPGTIIGVEVPPTHDYGRGVGTCIIGGMRYRGAKWAGQLGGKVLFGDHVRGRIWAMTPDGGDGPPVVEDVLSGFPTGNKAGLANFCTDSAGEIYLVTVNGTNQAGGTIRKLATAGISSEPPQFLSQTGVFSDLATLTAAPGVMSYEIANPLWSDGAAKKRWVILPNDGAFDTAAEKIGFSEDEAWTFPAGTVLVKNFEVSLDEADPSQVKRLETRFLICTADGGKYGVTYKWNPEGSDAELLTGGLAESYDVALAEGGVETRNWDYPSRADCLLCHNPDAGQALGFRTAPLNLDFHHPVTGQVTNQLSRLNALGLFEPTLTETQIRNFIAARPLDDETAPLEHRVRSYLDSNCAHCHLPDGTVDFFDARLGTPLIAQGLINGTIRGLFDLGPEGRYVKPGDPSLSALHVRLGAVGDGVAMPPLAKNEVDPMAVAAMEEYILGLNAGEFETAPVPQARFVRLTALSEVNGNEWTAVAEFTVLDGDGVAIPGSEVTLADFDSQEIENEIAPASFAIDGNPGTYWHTEWGGFDPPPPHHLTLDLGAVRGIGGFTYLPRQGSQNGRISQYQVDYSADGADWTPLDAGSWGNDESEKRFDSLTNQRPARCQLAGPSGIVDGTFEVTVVFDKDVADFESSDLQVSGGEVTDLRGSGYYYVATILPLAAEVAVSVPADGVDPAGEGSLASQVLSVGFVDTRPPAPIFTGVPVTVGGTFVVGLEFGEAVSGLQLSDFVISNGTLDAIHVDGPRHELTISPLAEGPVGIEILPGAVVDSAGNLMGAGSSVTVWHTLEVLARNAAEASGITGGMQVVNDPAAPHGAYLWLPDGAYPGNFNPPVKTQHRAEFSFVVPETGQWLLKGLARSPDSSSDSFWIEIDGNQGSGMVYLWDTQTSGSYVWDYLNHRGGDDPVVLSLSAGAHSVTVYGRDDGTQLDRLELESLRPRATLAGPGGAVGGAFAAILQFSEPVTGLEAADFSISGGAITSISGTGAVYSVTIVPSSSPVVASLMADSVTDLGGTGNFASNLLSVTYRTAYQQWAFGHGIDGSEEGRLSDDDGDGIVSLLEFAFGLDPTVADHRADDPLNDPPSGLPVMIVDESGDEPRLALRFLRREGVAGLGYEAQFGDALDDFASSTSVPMVEVLGNGWERVTVADDVSGPPRSRRFGRVVVELDDP